MKYRGQEYTKTSHQFNLDVKSINGVYRGVGTSVHQATITPPRRNITLKYRGVSL